jgi:hypothetical protein
MPPIEFSVEEAIINATGDDPHNPIPRVTNHPEALMRTANVPIHA